MAGRSLGYDARRTVTGGNLTAEVLGEHKLCIDTNRTGKDILSGEVDVDRLPLMQDRFVDRRDVVPIEIGAGRESSTSPNKRFLATTSTPNS